MQAMVNKPSYGYAWFCTALLVLCWLMTAMYLPMLPELKTRFDTTHSLVNVAISAYFLFFCFSQLIWGPLSDNYSRNKIISLTLLVALLGSLLCAISHNIELFIIGRSLQGLGIGAAPALTRSMINDLYPKKVIMRIMVYLSSIVAITCSTAPLLGTEMMNWWSWRGIFISQLVFAVILLLFNIIISMQYHGVSNLKAKNIVDNYRQALLNASVRFHLTSYSLIVGSLVAFYSVSPFIFMNILGMSAERYSFLLLSASFAYIAAVIAVRLLLEKVSVKNLLLLGTSICFIASLVAFSLIVFRFPRVWAITIPIFIYFFGAAVIPPITNTQAMQALPHIAGTVSSLLGSALAFAAAILSYVLNSLPLINPFSLGLFLLIITVIVGIYTCFYLYTNDKNRKNAYSE